MEYLGKTPAGSLLPRLLFSQALVSFQCLSPPRMEISGVSAEGKHNLGPSG